LQRYEKPFYLQNKTQGKISVNILMLVSKDSNATDGALLRHKPPPY